KIVPKKTSIKKLVKGRRYIKVTIGKVSKQCSGYTVQVATNSKFTKGVKTVSTKSYKTTVKKIKNLKSGKKYYVRVRAYKKVNGTRYSGSWSKVRTVTVK
ncbi:MAG: fibronectin type III domain-containing protein, partial [Eubacterium sp.]|nr:fibronectin type III domain-containing protein [Candidatus Colimonas fimequi]